MQSLRLSFSGAFALAALALFSFGCNSKPAAEKPVAPESAPAATAPMPAPTDSSAGTTQPAATDTAAQPAETAPAATPAPAAAPATPANNTDDLPNRTLSENRIGTQLIYISESITAQQLPYIVGGPALQDCSGIFLRITDSLKARIPALADKSKYTFPNANEHRSSRGIARWYHEHGNLHIVEDGKADANRIRPGSVMFFANTDQKYSNMNIDLLAGPPSGVPKGVIMHIATVVSVVKDDAGNVIKYTMMHGRNTKNPASPSGGNCDCGATTGKQHEKFPFGNWNQQWVAVANIETPVE
ncbi:MAG: hypothetical protein IPH12_01990 [Saprospirales bacterium]|nr:hypothetical protein [Saprospirales bacterium]MBK8921577.1 hypothetical protein [Saprospirales bacterium]